MADKPIRVCLLFFAFFIPLSDGGFVPFEDCGSAYYLESIEVYGCKDYPCRLPIGSTVTVTTNLRIQGTDFNPDNLVQAVYFVVSTIMLEVQVIPDPCTAVRGSNRTTCDLTVGERFAYRANLSVLGVPPLPATLFWTITNKATRELVVCYKLTVIITNH